MCSHSHNTPRTTQYTSRTCQLHSHTTQPLSTPSSSRPYTTVHETHTQCTQHTTAGTRHHTHNFSVLHTGTHSHTAPSNITVQHRHHNSTTYFSVSLFPTTQHIYSVSQHTHLNFLPLTDITNARCCHNTCPQTSQHAPAQHSTGASAHQYHCNQTLHRHDAQSKLPSPRRYFCTPRARHWAQQMPWTLQVAYCALTCVPVSPTHSTYTCTRTCCLSLCPLPALTRSPGQSCLPSAQFPSLMDLSQMSAYLPPSSLPPRGGLSAKPRRPSVLASTLDVFS